MVVEDAALPEAIVGTVERLMVDDDRRRKMADAARKLARPDAAARAAQLLLDLGLGRKAEPVVRPEANRGQG